MTRTLYQYQINGGGGVYELQVVQIVGHKVICAQSYGWLSTKG